MCVHVCVFSTWIANQEPSFLQRMPTCPKNANNKIHYFVLSIFGQCIRQTYKQQNMLALNSSQSDVKTKFYPPPIYVHYNNKKFHKTFYIHVIHIQTSIGSLARGVCAVGSGRLSASSSEGPTWAAGDPEVETTAALTGEEHLDPVQLEGVKRVPISHSWFVVS